MRAIERERSFEVDFLDLSRLASERDLRIHPCKACVSTAMPLDRDHAFQTEVRNVVASLVETVRQIRSGRYRRPDEGVRDPRPK